MKAIFTLYITENNFKKNCGFHSIEGMINSILLSSNLATKQFDKVEMYCTTFALQYLVNFPGEVFPVLDNIEFNPIHWSYPKVYVYALQAEPFIHIDFDCFLWNKFPEELLNNDFIFQQKELLGPLFPHYWEAIDLAINTGIASGLMPRKPEFAYNTALFGVTNLETLKVVQYYKFVVDRFIKQCKKRNRYHKDDVILFEQLFIAELIKATGEISVGTILQDNFSLRYKDCKFTHLLGKMKGSQQNEFGIKFKLNRLFPNATKPLMK